MPKWGKEFNIRRVDAQVSIFTAVIVVLSCLVIFSFHYYMTYNNMIDSLTRRMTSIYSFIEENLQADCFQEISEPEDMESEQYKRLQEKMRSVKESSGVRYLYTAKQTGEGSFVYVLDGLDPSAEDFRKPGDPIEPEIIPELQRAMSGEEILPRKIKDTGWGKIFIAYLPVHDGGKVIGVVGIEFGAEEQYNTYRTLRIATPIIIAAACLLSALFAVVFFRRISNPTYQDLSNTDYLTGLKSRNAFETDLKNAGRLWRAEHVGVIVADLNNLKGVNDTLGHGAGDLYLRTAARVIRECGAHSVAYRVGGDEFVLFSDQLDLARLEALTRTLDEGLRARRPEGWTMEFSMSAGCALYDPGVDKDLLAAYRRADGAMYEAKRRFREEKED